MAAAPHVEGTAPGMQAMRVEPHTPTGSRGWLALNSTRSASAANGDSPQVINNLVTPISRTRRRIMVAVGTLLVIAVVVAIVTRPIDWQNDGYTVPARHELVVDGNDTVVFLAFGDWGRGGTIGQRQTAQMMGDVANETVPDFIINVGDSFYEAGVQSVDDPQWDESFRKVYTHSDLQPLRFYGVFGNHDYRGKLQPQISYTADPRWYIPARNYTAAWPIGGTSSVLPKTACVSAVFIDTSPYIASYRTKKDSDDWKTNLAAAADIANATAWAEAALTAAEMACDAVVVVGHHPLWSGGDHGNSDDMIAAYQQRFVSHGVDVYIAGHDHTLIHLAKDDVEFVVTGGGSELRDNTQRTPETEWYSDVNGFSVHSFNATHMGVAYVGADGRLLFRKFKPLRGKKNRN